jgi:hypothetical protein
MVMANTPVRELLSVFGAKSMACNARGLSAEGCSGDVAVGVDAVVVAAVVEVAVRGKADAATSVITGIAAS